MSGAYVLIGATSPLGSSVARQLAVRGAGIVLGADDQEDLQRLAAETGGRAYPMDATHYEQVTWIIDHGRDVFGRVDGVATFVGTGTPKPPHLMMPEEFHVSMQSTVTIAFYTIRAAVRKMMYDGGGSILLISEVDAGDTDSGVPSATAEAMHSLARTSQDAYAQHRMRIRALRAHRPGEDARSSLAVAAARWLLMKPRPTKEVRPRGWRHEPASTLLPPDGIRRVAEPGSHSVAAGSAG